MKPPAASSPDRTLRRGPAPRPPAATDLSSQLGEPRISKAVLALICLALVIAILAIYGRTFGYGFVAYDDDKYVYENPVIKGGLTIANLR